jgi:hypothetical protein
MKPVYVLVVFLSASCAAPVHTLSNLDYLGNSFAATDSVTVFVDPAAIEKPYTVIGKGYVRSGTLGSVPIRYLQAEAIEKAKQHGANAVLILENFTPGGLNAVTKTDSTGREVVTVQSNSYARYGQQRFAIHFLKYKK